MQVKDMEGEEYSLVQCLDDIETFNQDYGTDYNYFFIEWKNECPCKVYGSYGVYLDDEVEFVSSSV